MPIYKIRKQEAVHLNIDNDHSYQYVAFRKKTKSDILKIRI